MGTRAFNAKFVSGSIEASDGDSDKEVIAAQGAGTVIRILSGYVSVTVAADGGGEVILEDGVDGTKLFRADADAVGYHRIKFDPPGYPLTANTKLNLAVEGATTQATATATIVADVVGS